MLQDCFGASRSDLIGETIQLKTSIDVVPSLLHKKRAIMYQSPSRSLNGDASKSNFIGVLLRWLAKRVG